MINNRGFTLVELSIVLVIIGLIVSAVLVGKELIASAQLRHTMSQIENYRTAVNSFYLKYSALPGDIADPKATSVGLKPRGAYTAGGNGNGLMEGYCSYCAGGAGLAMGTRIGSENLTFWVDLSTSNMIKEQFTLADPALTDLPTNYTDAASFSRYLPKASVGSGNYFYVYSNYNSKMYNYFGLSAVSIISIFQQFTTGKGLTVQQAYAIDTKLDDGLPESGRILAQYVNAASTAGDSNWEIWAAPTDVFATVSNAARSASVDSCFDNGGVVGVQKYSTTYIQGDNLNCALSFRF